MRALLILFRALAPLKRSFCLSVDGLLMPSDVCLKCLVAYSVQGEVEFKLTLLFLLDFYLIFFLFVNFPFTTRMQNLIQM